MPRVLAIPKVPISRVLDPCRHLDEITAMQQIVEQTAPIREERHTAAREWRTSVAGQFGLTSVSLVKS